VDRPVGGGGYIGGSDNKLEPIRIIICWNTWLSAYANFVDDMNLRVHKSHSLLRVTLSTSHKYKIQLFLIMGTT
jgi:hypothetical protein